MADAIVINSVTITPNNVSTNAQIKIVVDVMFLQPPTILFDRSTYDRRIWLPQ